MKRNAILRSAVMTVMLIAALAMKAGNMQYLSITVEGKQVVFSLADHPVITYANNTLLVKTPTEEVEIPVAKISGYEFTEEPSAIRDLKLTKPAIGGGLVVFSALQPGSTVTVAAADGRLLQTVSANADGTAIVDLSGQAKGVYVVSTKGGSIKVINK